MPDGVEIKQPAVVCLWRMRARSLAMAAEGAAKYLGHGTLCRLSIVVGPSVGGVVGANGASSFELHGYARLSVEAPTRKNARYTLSSMTVP